MQKSTVFLLVMALASAGVSAGLWMELRAERELNAELSERLNVAAATPIAAPPPVAQRPAEPVTTTAPVAATSRPSSSRCFHGRRTRDRKTARGMRPTKTGRPVNAG